MSRSPLTVRLVDHEHYTFVGHGTPRANRHQHEWGPIKDAGQIILVTTVLYLLAILVMA